MTATDADVPPPLSASVRTVRASGLDLAVARRGSGRPLLLMTGIGAHIDMWRPLDARVADRELIAFDAPGSGRSPAPPLPLRMGGYARIAERLLDALGLDRVDVLGYSWGAGLAQQLARQAPDRVRRLVLCAAGPGLGGIPPRPLAATLLASPARYCHPWLLKQTVPHIAGGRTRRERSRLDDQAQARLAHRPGVRGYWHQLYAISGWSSLPWLDRLRQPTLVVSGDDDPAVPIGNGRLLAARIPGARLHVVPDGGHLFLIDEPENVVPAILAFLDED